MPQNQNAPIYILGAGPAGLAAAYQLTKQGKSVVVVECDSRVGGLAKSFEYQGFILDFGPHRFFTKITPVLNLWNEVLGTEQVTVKRLTRIYYNHKYFSYPLKAVETLSTLGIFKSVQIVLSYFAARLFSRRHPRNFAEWVTGKFGKQLFQIFFEGYTEKLWGIPCHEISADWAAQRIKGLSLMKAMRNAILGNDGKVKNMIDQFQFPRLGSGQLYENISHYLQSNQQVVLLNTEVTQLDCDKDKVIKLGLKNRITGEESTVRCDGVISSIPLNSLITKVIFPQPKQQIIDAANSLKFRNTILVYLIVESTNIFPDNWLYINDPTVHLGRVTNFANWSPDMLANHRQTPLCCEYWCNFGELMWQQSEAELVAMAESELRKIRLLNNEKVSAGFVIRLPKTYPIYTGDYQNAIATIQDYLSQFQNLQVIGRSGSFKYNNQDHSLLMGILAAENVINPGKHYLWEVNSDSEYAEEVKIETFKTPVPNVVQYLTNILSATQVKSFHQLFKQFASYLLTGGSATIIDVLFFTLLTQMGLWYVFALCISYFVGLTTNFYLSRQYVFRVYWKNWFIQYLVFGCIALNSLLANLGLLQLLVNDLQWQKIPARIVSAGCVAFLSFAGHKLYSFSEKSSLENQAK